MSVPSVTWNFPLTSIQLTVEIPHTPRVEAVQNTIGLTLLEFSSLIVTEAELQRVRAFILPFCERLYHRPVSVIVDWSAPEGLVFIIDGVKY